MASTGPLQPAIRWAPTACASIVALPMSANMIRGAGIASVVLSPRGSNFGSLALRESALLGWNPKRAERR